MSTIGDEVLTLVHAFSDKGRKDAVRDLAARVEQAIAVAREEQREACAVLLEQKGVTGWAFEVRFMPLTATPLADRIAELTRERDEALRRVSVLEKFDDSERTEALVQRDEARALLKRAVEALDWFARPDGEATYEVLLADCRKAGVL